MVVTLLLEVAVNCISTGRLDREDPSRLKAQKEYNQPPLQVKPEMTIILFRNLKQDQGRTLAIVYIASKISGKFVVSF